MDEKESAILANVVGVFIKDLLTEDIANCSQDETYMPYSDENNLPLLETADDEDEHFFKKCFFEFQQPLIRNHGKRPARISLDSESSVSEEDIAETSSKRPKVELNLLNRFFNPITFENHLHMRKMTFLKIFQSLRNLLPSNAFPTFMTPQSAFSLSLWKLATDEHFEQIANKFSIPLPECHTTIKQFWHLVSDNYESFIEWPKSPETQESTLAGFRTHPQFKRLSNIFGIIANKHLNIFLESLDAEVPAVMQIVCNVDMRIIDCYVELEQNYTFETSPLGQTLALRQAMPPNSYLLGDETFPLKSYLMRPFENKIKKERNFNALLEPAVQLGQKTLDSLAQRFNTLYALEAKDLHEVRRIVETVCALHNLCVDVEDDFVERGINEGKFNWSKTAPPNRIGESNVEGLRRRYELLDAVICASS